MAKQTTPPLNHKRIGKLLDGVVDAVGLKLNQPQRDQLATHFLLLLKWNEKINLTSIRQPEEIATRHFEESLYLSRLLTPPRGVMVDVGSGAGFPGLPLKIVWPEVAAVLLEPNQKKATFLKEVVRNCRLEGVAVRTERLETVAHGDLAGWAALVTMRAVALTPKLLQGLRRLLQAGGQLALFVGLDAAAQLRHSHGILWEDPVALPNSEQRVILLGTAPVGS